jgi:hypothetical protein
MNTVYVWVLLYGTLHGRSPLENGVADSFGWSTRVRPRASMMRWRSPASTRPTTGPVSARRLKFVRPGHDLRISVRD